MNIYYARFSGLRIRDWALGSPIPVLDNVLRPGRRRTRGRLCVSGNVECPGQNLTNQRRAVSRALHYPLELMQKHPRVSGACIDEEWNAAEIHAGHRSPAIRV